MDEYRSFKPIHSANIEKWAVAVVVLAIVAPALGEDDNPELQKFRGAWEVVELVEDGRVISPDRIREMLPSGGRVEIIENTIIFRSPRDKKQHAKVFSIEPTKYPKTIDIGDAQGNQSRGIYQFDQGKLVVCVADPDSADRPDQFSADVESQRMLLVLKKLSSQTRQRAEKTPRSPQPAPKSAPVLKGLTDADVARLLAGTWVLKDSAGSLYVTFRADKTFSSVREYQELRLFHKSFVQTPMSEGSWKVENGKLTAYVRSSADFNRVNRLFTFSVRSISTKDMIFVDQLGRVVRTSKVRRL